MVVLFNMTLLPSIAQNRKKNTDTNLFGHVLDASTNEHLPYVTLMVKGTTVGTTTDASGHYMLKNLPVGKYTLIVRFVGYDTLEKEINLVQGKTLELDFSLKPSQFSLNEVVVSANRNETNRQKAPSLVSVLDMKMVESTNSKNLSQALNFQPGLRVEDNCQNCGFTQVRINGLQGAYSQILIDSRPIFGALTGVYGLEQIPTNMIDRVEVIRGGGSALFGSSAIGGVVNVITKEPMRNSGDISHTLLSIGGKSVENNTMFNGSVLTDDRNVGVMVFGQYRDRPQYDHDGDGFSELPMLRNRSFGFRSFIKTGLYSKLSFEYHNMHEFRRGGDRMDQPPFNAEIAEQVEHNINGGGLNFVHNTADLKHKFNLYASTQHTLRDSYYGGGTIFDFSKELTDKEKQDLIGRLTSLGKSKEVIYHVGGQYTYSMDKFLFLPAELTTGAEYLQNTLNDRSGYRSAEIHQSAKTASAFLQNEWKNEQWSVLLGGRLDKHSLVKKAILSPRANIRYNPNGKINFRISYSEGFRAPQYFDEDLHVELAQGENIVRELSKDLKEERSRSVSGSIDFYHVHGGWQFNTLLEGFYTHLLNPFTTEDKGNGKRLVVNAVGQGAVVSGINVEGRMNYQRVFDLQLGFTLQKSRYDTPQQPLEEVESYREFMRSPNSYGYFVATYNPIRKLSLTLSGNYTGKMLVPHEAGSGVKGVDRFAETNRIEKTSSFFELGTKIAYDFEPFRAVSMQLNAGVQNITNQFQQDADTGAGRASAYVYGPSLPRSYFVGVKLSL